MKVEGQQSKVNRSGLSTFDFVEQIERLIREHFDGADAGWVWLKKNFDVEHPRDLLTAKRAGQVIHVLKEMVSRRGETCTVEW